MEGGGEEVEGYSPVGEDGEVGEGGTGDGTAVQFSVGAVPGENEDLDREGIEALGSQR